MLGEEFISDLVKSHWGGVDDERRDGVLVIVCQRGAVRRGELDQIVSIAIPPESKSLV